MLRSMCEGKIRETSWSIRNVIFACNTFFHCQCQVALSVWRGLINMHWREREYKTQQCALTTQGDQMCPELHQKRGQQVERGDSTPQFCTYETPPGALHLALRSSEQERCWDLLEWVQRRPVRQSEGRSTSPMKSPEWAGVVQPWEWKSSCALRLCCLMSAEGDLFKSSLMFKHKKYSPRITCFSDETGK